MVDKLYQSIVNVNVGKRTKLWRYVNLYGCTIGDDCMIGTYVEIQSGVTVGNKVLIQSHTFVCEGVTIEDEVFIGHGVMFINDKYPHAIGDWKLLKTVIKKGASIGSNATILGGITIGEGALVGAGSVVTKDVPAYTVVAGNPAKFLKKTIHI